MTTEQIASILSAKRGGTFYTVTVNRPAKVRKGVSDTIIKRSVMQGMMADYANRKAVREAVESGDRDAPEMPAWAESIEINGVRFWRNRNSGAEYLPVCITGNNARTTWFRNGAEVALEEIAEALLASEIKPRQDKDELADKGQVPFVAVTVGNIESVQ